MKKVAVLMSTYNGANYIEEQIESILKQKGVIQYLYIRDDGSSDKTVDILRQYETHERIYITEGNNIGYAYSFLKLLMNCGEYDYYCFADQDDIWKPEKLINAVTALEEVATGNKFYCSSMTVVDENLKFQYINEFKKLKLSLGSSMIRQRIAGCTMVFDRSLKNLLVKCKSIQDDQLIITHDLLVYTVCCMTGGTPVFANNPDILYRRHSNTVTSYGKGFINRICSYLKVFSVDKNRKYKEIKYLENIFREDICESEKELIYDFLNYKNSFYNTLKLVLNKEVNSNILLLNLIAKIAILTRSL